jgi:hypothetical protein
MFGVITNNIYIYMSIYIYVYKLYNIYITVYIYISYILTCSHTVFVSPMFPPYNDETFTLFYPIYPTQFETNSAKSLVGRLPTLEGRT